MTDTKTARLIGLAWRINVRGDKTHWEWTAPCGCAYHPEPSPHVHKCAEHEGEAPAEIQVAVRKANPKTIRISVLQGALRLDDGSKVGSISSLGPWVSIDLDGLGHWEINLLEATHSIMAAEGRPETGPLSHNPEGTSDGR